ncbi:MAG: IS30 family transposase [Spirochaetia bacterium]|nr:IS30 family transposase [Spirochaetia bacterium]
METIKNKSEKVYQHLSPEEREEIACLLEKGLKKKEIAKKLNRSPSTISREIQRNSTEIRNCRYRGHRAQMRSDERKSLSHKKFRLKDSRVKRYVRQKLKAGLSPEQIAGRIGKDLPGCKTNYESIYLFVYHDCPELTEFLVWGRRKRRKRAIKAGKRVVKIPNRVMIDKRPKYINERKSLGHWEADTVVSRQSKSSLVVIRERKLQIMYIRKVPRKSAKHMRQAVINILKKIPKRLVRSITFDNGLENAEHERIAKALGLKTYFCNPYHSWEKGGVENGIGLIRRFLPKKTDFSLIAHSTIRKIQYALNNRPRKSLKFWTPMERLKIALSH